MQLQYEGHAVDGLSVRLNTAGMHPLAVVSLRLAQLIIETTEDADELIKAAVEAKRLLSPPAPETVPWPTGLCGHTVTPGAWSHGFTRCRDCLVGTTPDSVSWYDRATAGEPMQASCRCGHAEDAHHLDMVNDKSTHCNACNACDKFAVAGTRASVTA